MPPASVTVIIADDIRHVGNRSLADALSHVNGVCVNYDHSHLTLGIRDRWSQRCGQPSRAYGLPF
jgi:outer membrane receptor for ferrienterochelin and colicin